MAETIKGGELARRAGASGITVNGRPLEEVLSDETSDRLTRTLIDKGISAYHKCGPHYKERKEPPGVAKIYTQREINEIEWEKLMTSQDTVEGIFAALLLSGQEVSSTDVRSKCMEILDCKQSFWQQRFSYIINKTDFGKLLIRRKIKRTGVFRLVPAAFDLTVKELKAFVYKDNKSVRSVILSEHKGLHPYLEDKAPASTITSEPQHSVPQTLDVNVKIEVTFKFS